jgi:competence protein ComEC
VNDRTRPGGSALPNLPPGLLPVYATPSAWLAAGLAGTGWALWGWPVWMPAQAFGVLVLALLGILFAVRLRRRLTQAGLGPLAAAVLLLAIVAAALAATQLRIADRLQHRLDPALEGRDLLLTGVVASLPQHGAQGLRFVFHVEQARWRGDPLVIGAQVPERVSMGWFTGFHEDATLSQPQLALKAGQRWTFRARLRQPHGPLNPHGFDLERFLFVNDLRATGAVRDAPPQAVETDAGYPVQRWRQWVRDRLLTHTGDTPAAGVLAALVVGDQSAIGREEWDLFRDTGVAHLMAISGLHVTMFAWAAGGLIGLLWRGSTRACLRLPAPTAARLGGLAAALAYAVFSGWGVPAQRTVWMLAVVTLLVVSGRRWPWSAVLLAAAAVVAVLDPWALLDIGFWLSFVAVGLLMLASPGLARPRDAAVLAGSAVPDAARSRWLPAWRRLVPAWLGDAMRTQWIATIGLAPLTLVLFQQVSLVGFVANLVAVPWVTLVVTPLAMLGALLPWAWTLAAWAVEGMTAGLQGLAQWPWAVWTVPAVPWWWQAAALLGGVVAVLPVPWWWRLQALPLMLPLLWPVVPRPPFGQFELVAVDVGQGTAAIVRTRDHVLVYDTGPQTGRDSDAGQRILVPLLRARGDLAIDRLVLSHRDLDHVGGAASVLRGARVTELRSSLEAGHPLLGLAREQGARVEPCAAAQRWTWDGVQFEFLHPREGAIDRSPEVRARANELSCVLKVTAAGAGAGAASGGAAAAPDARPPGPRSVLLTGDIERASESLVVAAAPDSLPAEILFVPHHGSRTSSSIGFIEAVAPRWAVVQAGYRSRFGHPAPEVVQRYRERGVTVVASPGCGAWTWRAGEAEPICERARVRRHWQHPDPGAP